MIILVPSVHHTGTKTVFNDMLKGWTVINQQDPNPPDDGKIRIHIDKAFLEDLDYWLKRAKTIVPLRHPRSVAIGWKRRWKPLTLLDWQWNWLKENVDPYNPYYLPVDQEDRDSWLLKINKGLGTDFKTDWPVIGHSEAPLRELEEKDEYLVRSWMEDGFFERFGYT